MSVSETGSTVGYFLLCLLFVVLLLGLLWYIVLWYIRFHHKNCNNNCMKLKISKNHLGKEWIFIDWQEGGRDLKFINMWPEKVLNKIYSFVNVTPDEENSNTENWSGSIINRQLTDNHRSQDTVETSYVSVWDIYLKYKWVTWSCIFVEIII